MFRCPPAGNNVQQKTFLDTIIAVKYIGDIGFNFIWEHVGQESKFAPINTDDRNLIRSNALSNIKNTAITPDHYD